MKDAATERNKGLIEEVSGKIKKRIGKLVGNDPMQAKGRAKEIKGKMRQASARATERVGKIKKRVGRAIENGQKQVELKARDLKGKTRLGASR